MRSVTKLCVCLALVLTGLGSFAQEKLTADDLVARHLAALGAAPARAAVKSRTVQANTQFAVLTGTPKTNAQGSTQLVALDRRLIVIMRYPGTTYPDEQILFDGKKLEVSLGGNKGDHSPMADFLYLHPMLVREGLFGGALRSSWSLLNLEELKPRLKYQGLKKVDGRELHDLSYVPKKDSDADLTIHLYFEPDTYRHVKTVYIFTAQAGLAHTPDPKKGIIPIQGEAEKATRYTLEEDFSDFRVVDGITLPGRWNMRYTIDGARTLATKWESTVTAIAHNNVTE